MSSRDLPTLELELGGQRMQRRSGVALLVITALAPALVESNIGFAAALGVSLMTAVGLGIGFRHAGWFGGGQALARMTWRADGTWVLQDASGRRCEAVLHPESRMSPSAIWLRWRPTQAADGPHKPLSARCLLTRRDLPEGDFRRLLVRLRMDRAECATPLQPPFTVST